jgi:hypothetical protein
LRDPPQISRIFRDRNYAMTAEPAVALDYNNVSDAHLIRSDMLNQ